MIGARFRFILALMGAVASGMTALAFYAAGPAWDSYDCQSGQSGHANWVQVMAAIFLTAICAGLTCACNWLGAAMNRSNQ